MIRARSTLAPLAALVAAALFGWGCPPQPDEGITAGDCVDGSDNDGDGAFDCDDSGCTNSPDCPSAADDDDVADDDDAGSDDDDGAPDDDDGAPDDDDDGGNVTVIVQDGPGVTTTDATLGYVFVMNPNNVQDGFPQGKPVARADSILVGGRMEVRVDVSDGSTVTLIAFVDENRDDEVCTAGDHHGFVSATGSTTAQTVTLELVNVLTGEECVRDGKPD